MAEIEDYIEIAPDLLIRKEVFNLLSKIDSVVLDIDGVILDVSQSFRKAISETVQYFFSKVLKWPGETYLITPEETQMFKMAGGFNNDWELTYAVVLFYLGKSAVLLASDLKYLREKGKSINKFTVRIKEKGGGLAAVEELVFKPLVDVERECIEKLWQKDLIRQIFQEFYAGVDYCERLYGFKPEFVGEKGLLNKESVLLNKELLEPFYSKIAIITGRTKEETEVALERAELSSLISFEKIIYDDGVLLKPDPKILLSLGEKIETRVGIYIGDILDDLKMVNNFKKLASSMTFISGIVLRNEAEKFNFIEENVDILSKNVNDILLAVVKSKGENP